MRVGCRMPLDGIKRDAQGASTHGRPGHAHALVKQVRLPKRSAALLVAVLNDLRHVAGAAVQAADSFIYNQVLVL
jgi:hypothetical protein